MSVLVQVVAAAAFVMFAFSLFRFSMGLRWAKVSREAARKEVLGTGQRLLAELPLPTGEVAFLLEDATAFAWGQERCLKALVHGVRMRLNGGVLAEFVKDGVRLPSPEPPEEYEGRERWDVALFGADGFLAAIPCGNLREGVSREVATIVFEAVKRGVAEGAGKD
ncbi:MAG TPA: hypothetical protein VMV21_05545 [Vicinamibacteria bacterium]|nr:hypothetical protein [Vicinamibacteria bacterium]